MKAWQLLEREGAWTQGQYARMGNGLSCDPRDEKAVNWCLIGALSKCHNFNPDYTPYNEVVRRVYRNLKTGVTTWNDAPERTQAEVAAKLKELDL